MRPLFRSLALGAALALSAGCNSNLTFDPEGYRCDPGGLCPTGYGCVDGVCHPLDAGGCSLVCTPPTATCVDSSTLRTFSGGCEAASGQCIFQPTDMPCPSGCQSGACVDSCTGVSCVSPPDSVCTGPSTLHKFNNPGTCSQGACSYSATDIPCANGCDGGVCVGDLCAGVTCTVPPMAICVGNSSRTFGSPGTCEPANGQCQYPPTDTPCPSGCTGGVCGAPSLTFTQVGPRVRFPITAIDVAPNSAGSSALAVGPAGKMARWNGMRWTEVATPSQVALNKVAFVSPSLAYVVGENKTVWTYDPSASLLTPVTVAGANSTRLVGVSGRSASDVFLSDDVGGWWHLTFLSGWQNGVLPAGEGPYQMTDAYLDESGRERIVGRCRAGGVSCVAYRYPGGGTPAWRVDARTDTLGFDAVGGGFDVPTSVTVSEIFTGQKNNDLLVHANSGTFTQQTVTPGLSGSGIVGIAAQDVPFTRAVYVLTSSGGGVGHLLRLIRNGTTVSSTEMLDTYQGREVLSPNEASGVLVAEVNRPGRSNNIFRRSATVDQALDVGEDLAGASLDSAGTLVLSSVFGDVASLPQGSPTFNFWRAPDYVDIYGMEARNGTGTLLVGSAQSGLVGMVYRVLPSGFTELPANTAATWKAVCRVSDSEAWVVGSGGTIASITTSAVNTVPSPTSEDLLAVDCGPGFAVAVGVNGTVVVYEFGSWTLAPQHPGGNRPLTAVALAGRVAFAGGDGIFARLEQGVWTPQASRVGLRSLVARGPTEVYGTVGGGNYSEVQRFDGNQWGPPLVQVDSALKGGVHVGGRVVWGGSGGVVVEGR